jgi:ferritin-like metal-binding protein YciE
MRFNMQRKKVTRVKKVSPEKRVFRLEDILREQLQTLQVFTSSGLVFYNRYRKECHSEGLAQLFSCYQVHCETQSFRLKGILEKLGIRSFIRENNESHSSGTLLQGIAEEIQEGPLKDIVLTMRAQEIEYLQIASYRSTCELCETLGYYKIGETLDISLAEHENAKRELEDQLRILNELAGKEIEFPNTADVVGNMLN